MIFECDNKSDLIELLSKHIINPLGDVINDSFKESLCLIS